MAQSRNFRLGVALAIVNIVVGAFLPVITRWAALKLDPLLFCAGSVIVAGLCLATALYLGGELGTLADARYLARLLTLSILGTVATSFSLVYGLKHVSAITGVLMLQTEPAYSLLLATIVVGERPSARQLIATAAILAGVASVFGGGAAWAASTAACLLLLTPLFWQTAHVLSLAVMPPLSPTCITGARYIYASVPMAAVLIVFDASALRQLADPAALGAIALTGVFIYFIGTLSWYGAISRLSLAWTTALVVPGMPLLSIVFAVAFLGEHTSMRQAAGIAVAVSGVLGLVLGASPHRPRSAAEVLEGVHQPVV